jgi:competence protein ComEC
MPLLPILRKSPFSRLIFLYAIGIAFTDCLRNNLPPVGIFLFIIFILWLFLWRIVNTSRNLNTGWISGILVSMLIFICGIWAAEIDHKREQRAESLPEDIRLYRMVVTDIPDTKAHVVKATARVLEMGTAEGWIHYKLKALLYISADSGACLPLPGSELILRAALKNIPGPSNPEGFDYHKYLAIRHIYKQCFIILPPRRGGLQPPQQSDLQSPRRGGGDPVGVSPCRMRNRLLQSFREIGLEPAYFGLVSALTLGYKEDVDASAKEAFTRAGVMHIMALSGFNVGIIALVLGFVLGVFEKNPAGKFIKTLIIVLFLWLFAWITGLSPSVTRATVMISCVMTGRLFNRHVNTYNILFVSAFLLLTFCPGMISDVSFQLSFTAVLGILVYQPVLSRLVTFKNSLAGRIWQLFTLSCAAQLATFPLTLFYFHQFPVYFWLTNLYVVPLVSVIICVAGGYLAIAWIRPVALLTGKILAFLLKTLLISVNVVERLPFSLIEGVYINRIQAVLLMLLIFLLALIILFKTVKWFPVLFILVFAFETIHLVQFFHLYDQQTALISSVKGTTGITIISGRKALLLMNASSIPDMDDLSFTFRNFWIRHGVNPTVISLDRLSPDICNGLAVPGLFCRTGWRGNNILFTFNGQRLVLLRDDRFYKYRSGRPMQVDYIIITGSLSVRPEGIAREIQSNMVILDGSIRKPNRNKWKKGYGKIAPRYYVIPEQGAFSPGVDYRTLH